MASRSKIAAVRVSDAAEDESVSTERAVACPRCGGAFEERLRTGNPFLSVKPMTRVVCVDCGLDSDALERMAGDW